MWDIYNVGQCYKVWTFATMHYFCGQNTYPQWTECLLVFKGHEYAVHTVGYIEAMLPVVIVHWSVVFLDSQCKPPNALQLKAEI